MLRTKLGTHHLSCPLQRYNSYRVSTSTKNGIKPKQQKHLTLLLTANYTKCQNLKRASRLHPTLLPYESLWTDKI